MKIVRVICDCCGKQVEGLYSRIRTVAAEPASIGSIEFGASGIHFTEGVAAEPASIGSIEGGGEDWGLDLCQECAAEIEKATKCWIEDKKKAQKAPPASGPDEGQAAQSADVQNADESPLEDDPVRDIVKVKARISEKRSKEIKNLVYLGHSDNQIAKELGIPEAKIAKHVKEMQYRENYLAEKKNAPASDAGIIRTSSGVTFLGGAS